MLICDKTFELDYDFSFIEAKTEDIRADFKGSILLEETCSAICKGHIRIAETMLLCTEALNVFAPRI